MMHWKLGWAEASLAIIVQSPVWLLSLQGNSRQLRGVLLYFTLNDVQGILASYLRHYFSHSQKLHLNWKIQVPGLERLM